MICHSNMKTDSRLQTHIRMDTYTFVSIVTFLIVLEHPYPSHLYVLICYYSCSNFLPNVYFCRDPVKTNDTK